MASVKFLSWVSTFEAEPDFMTEPPKAEPPSKYFFFNSKDSLDAIPSVEWVRFNR